MTIQRQYNLPNCKLIVEGLSDEANPYNGTASRPPLSIVMNAECHFVGQAQPLTGGREFLESLITTVSHYAQSFLSGIPHPLSHNGKVSIVQIQRVEHDLHRLTVQPQEPGDRSTSPVQVDLKTVQLFDLVEAIDQLAADVQTLPNLKLNLAPVPKRLAATQEPIAKRAVPAAIGISGLAAAAAVLFFLPLPEVRRPEPVSEQTNAPTATASPTAAGSPPSPPPPSPVESPSPEAAASTTESPSPEASPSPEESPSAEESPAAEVDPFDAEAIGGILNTAPEILEPETLDRLTQNVRTQLSQAWTERAGFDEDLVYRVGVAEDGDILGFRYVNQAAIDYVDRTPLLDLRYNNVDTANPEPLAQFRVVFTPDGVVQVSPWHGRPNP